MDGGIWNMDRENSWLSYGNKGKIAKALRKKLF
jgi:hypothetical protein